MQVITKGNIHLRDLKMIASKKKFIFNLLSVRYFACKGTIVTVKQWSVLLTTSDCAEVGHDVLEC
jgi:hypothetical protein